MLLIANLDFEAWLAAGKAPGSLNRQALQAATRAGMLLGALGSRGDRVWLPGPAGYFKPLSVPGLEPVEFIHGRLPAEWDGPVLAWGETSVTASLGTGAGRPRGEGSPILDAVLAAPRADVDSVRSANRKTGLIRLREELDCVLPGSGVVRSLDDLGRLRRECGRIYGDRIGWVLKADYSAAGRERVLGLAGSDSTPRHLDAAERLLSRHGACLYEPWLDRTGDFGCSLIIHDDKVVLAGVHRLLNSSLGRFQGVETILDHRKEPGPVLPDGFRRYLEPVEARRMATVAQQVGSTLARNGYQGVVGIDFWRYATSEGPDRFNLVGEINARLTFGLVAAVLAQRVGQALGAGPGTRFLLSFGPENLRLKGRSLPLLKDSETGSSVVTLFIS